jgi:hypothetical protein
MARLTVENLEGRELLSAGVITGAAFSPQGPPSEGLVAATVAAGYTAPIGSNKGSLMFERAEGGVGSDFLHRLHAPYTYPDHANFAGDAYLNEMGVIATNRGANGIIPPDLRFADVLDGTSNTLLLADPQEAGGANGIIAVLIGLREPAPPAVMLLHGDFATFQSNVTSSFQGGCSSADGDAGRVFQTLPYMEQGNLYKQVTAAVGTRAVEILPYLEQDNL